ncbi:MAG TPA: helix-turn-helix transcriptional regulator [Roseiflexaceae bacterium]|mgnify:CR=1 FL=1|nr:helix-turn-helix transcriptional regulator [Roseiflexaceae bacterium]HMP41953.1 helix-turn-helix transcriptional regulator [Roseiflexaceae bacterium]
MQHPIYDAEFVMFSAVNRAAWYCPPHAHACYELLYVHEGCCRITTESGVYTAQPQHLVLFRPYQWHEEQILTPLYSVACLRFPAEFAAEYRVPLPEADEMPTVVPLAQSDRFRVVLDSMIDEYQRRDGYSAAMIGSYLFQLAVLLRRTLQHESDRMTSSQARELQHLLDQYITSAVPLRELARHAHMSESHFSHRVKALLGMPPKMYVRERRIERAIELLESTDLPIDEIAATLGYDATTSFFRAFKRVTGRSPGVYRQQRSFG